MFFLMRLCVAGRPFKIVDEETNIADSPPLLCGPFIRDCGLVGAAALVVPSAASAVWGPTPENNAFFPGAHTSCGTSPPAATAA